MLFAWLSVFATILAGLLLLIASATDTDMTTHKNLVIASAVTWILSGVFVAINMKSNAVKRQVA